MGNVSCTNVPWVPRRLTGEKKMIKEKKVEEEKKTTVLLKDPPGPQKLFPMRRQMNLIQI